MTLHGAGMITGSLLVMMGALWYVLHPSVPLRPGRMLASYALIVGGVLAVLVATLVGGFGAGWTFLPPLPFYPAGQWSVWSESVFFVGKLLVGTGFFVYCIDVLEQTTTTYGGLTRALGLAVPARARVGGAAAAGDRRHGRRDRRPALDARGSAIVARPARPHLRHAASASTRSSRRTSSTSSATRSRI